MILHNNRFKRDFSNQVLETIDQWTKIDSTDFTPVIERLCAAAPDGEGWSKAKAEFAIEEYRRFLKLNSKYGDKRIVPNRMIDTVWHTHILDTRKYSDDCEIIFGRFLHHFPYFGLRGDAHERDEAFNVTLTLYAREFGTMPVFEKHYQAQEWGSSIRFRAAAGCDAADIRAAGCDGADIEIKFQQNHL